MYRNFSINEKEKREILEMHTTKGYKKSLNENDAEDYEIDLLKQDRMYDDDRTKEEREFDDKKESLLNSILKMAEQLNDMDVTFQHIRTYLIDRGSKFDDTFFQPDKYITRDQFSRRGKHMKISPREKRYNDLPGIYNKEIYNKETGKTEYHPINK